MWHVSRVCEIPVQISDPLRKLLGLVLSQHKVESKSRWLMREVEARRRLTANRIENRRYGEAFPMQGIDGRMPAVKHRQFVARASRRTITQRNVKRSRRPYRLAHL